MNQVIVEKLWRQPVRVETSIHTSSIHYMRCSRHGHNRPRPHSNHHLCGRLLPGPFPRKMRTERYRRYSPFMPVLLSSFFHAARVISSYKGSTVADHPPLLRNSPTKLFPIKSNNNDIDGDEDQVFCKAEVIFHVTHERQLYACGTLGVACEQVSILTAEARKLQSGEVYCPSTTIRGKVSGCISVYSLRDKTCRAQYVQG